MLGLLTNFKLLGSLAGLAAIATGVLLYTQAIKSSAKAELQVQLSQQRQEMSRRIDEAVQAEQAKQYSLQQKISNQEDKLNASIDSAGDCGTVPDVQLYLQSIGSPTGPAADPRSP